jgi:SAM-dependent methyltransferase
LAAVGYQGKLGRRRNYIMKKTRINHSSDFYEQLAPLYHLKVDWDKRLPKETALFEYLLGDPEISAVCDLGCGDGGHAREVVRRGAVYVGMDNSTQMIRLAKTNYSGVRGVRFVKADMRSIPALYNRMFDLVLLLGNTLPHMLTSGDLSSVFRAVHRMLNPGGRFVLQTVNPGKLKDRSVHFLPPKLADERFLFTPLYVRHDELWEFLMPIYVLEQQRIVSHQVLTTQLRFWTRREVVTAAKKHFRTVRVCGSADLSPYQENKSENLLLVLERI